MVKMIRGDKLSINVLLLVISFVVFILFFVVESNGSDGKEYHKYYFTELPSDFKLNVGEELNLDLDYLEGYRFSEDSDLVTIEKEDGKFSFSSDIPGNFSVVFIALKDVYSFDYRLVNFEVVSSE